MQTLVTGGCGFIGSHLVDHLIAAGHDVSVLDNLSSGDRDHLHPHAELTVGDVANAAIVRPLVARADAVFHLAAVASVARCDADWLNAHRSNVTGTVTIFDAAARAAKPQGKRIPVIYASSAAVYGDARERPTPETMPVAPLSAYGVDKHSAERYGEIAWQFHGVPNVGLRFFNVYGPRQNPASPYSGVISKFMAAARAGEPLTFFGDGEQTRDFIHVADIVALAMAAWAHAGSNEIYNGCTGQETSLLALADIIERIAARPLARTYAPAQPGDIRHSGGSPLKAQNILNFTAQTALEDGLRQLYASEAAHAA